MKKVDTMAQISNFLIGMILIGLFGSVFSVFMAGMADSTDIAYDNSTLEVYNKLDVLIVNLNQTQSDLNEIKERSGILDIIGGIFSSAYNVLLTTQDSFDLFRVMSNDAVDDLDIGITGDLFLNALSTIVLVVIVFLILAVILKWEV